MLIHLAKIKKCDDSKVRILWSHVSDWIMKLYTWKTLINN